MSLDCSTEKQGVISETEKIVAAIIDAEFRPGGIGPAPQVVLVNGSTNVDKVTVSLMDEWEHTTLAEIILDKTFRQYRYGVDRKNWVLAVVDPMTALPKKEGVRLTLQIDIPNFVSQDEVRSRAAGSLLAYACATQNAQGPYELLDRSNKVTITGAEWNG